jgi:hypothetical protein
MPIQKAASTIGTSKATSIAGLRRRLAISAGLAIALSFSMVSTYATASFESGNDLLSYCEEKDSGREWKCLGYIIAIFDVILKNEINGFRACPPDNITQGQAQDVAVLWIKNHPKNRHLSASSLVAAAFDDAFPCP